MEGFTYLLKTYISSVKDGDLIEEDILDSLTPLSRYIPRFLKSLVRHNFPATKLITETYPQLMQQLSETLHYIYNPNWFPQNFIAITQVPSETIQKLSINHNNIELINYNAENQPLKCTDITENVNMSHEASPIEILDTIVHSQPTDTYINETAETDFNSTLLDDGTLFSSKTVNTLIDIEEHGHNITRNNNTTFDNETTNNKNVYQNQQNRQTVNSTELRQNSDPLNTIRSTLPNVYTPLPRLLRQNSVHFNTEPVILNISQQPTLANNQNLHITQQQLVNLVRQPNSHNTQQTTNAPTSYYLQAASTQTPSPAVYRNTQMTYFYLGDSVPMQQLLRPFDGTDPSYTTEYFLNAITVNMVMTAGHK